MAQGTTSRRAAGPSTRGRGWALLAVSLGFAVVQLDVSVVNVAITSIGAELGSGVTGLQWVVNAYTLTFAALILSAGALGDRIGAKRVFLAGFVVFTLASVGCGFAPNLPVLIGCRAVQGVGAAVLVPCSLTLLSHAYPDADERARAVGLWAAGASVALSAGPLVGGALTAVAGWRAIFFINVPIGVLAIALTQRYASETPRASERGVDLPGQAAAIVSLVALAAATIQGGHGGFGRPMVLAGYALAAVAGAAFVLIEARTARPMLPLSLFESRTFSAATALGLFVNIAFYGLIFVFSLYFQTARHYSALGTGLAFAPITIAVLTGNLVTGRLVRVVGARWVLAGSTLVMAAALTGLLVIGADTPYPEILAQLVVLGLALGLIVPAMTAVLLGSVDASNSGIASGVLNTARQTGSLIGVALFGSLAAAHLVAGLRAGLCVSIAAALAAAALTMGISSADARR